MDPLKTISYFSIFQYPLTLEEIFTFSNSKSKELLIKELTYLVDNNVIYKIGEYYSDVNNQKNIQRRQVGNLKAKGVMPKALKISKLISNFPYIESVCISGSLSKGYFEEKSDIDFFIITKRNRLWIARTLLIAYKKIFLLNSKKYFCVNYFMSSGYLKVDEENRFTATEIATLIPMYGKKTYDRFIKTNKWVTDYFPNLHFQEHEVKLVSKNLFSKGIEAILNTKLGHDLERFFMKITIKKWNAEFDHLSNEDFEIAFKSSEEVSKHHPQNFQKKVLSLLNEKYAKIEKKHQIKLTPENV